MQSSKKAHPLKPSLARASWTMDTFSHYSHKQQGSKQNSHLDCQSHFPTEFNGVRIALSSHKTLSYLKYNLQSFLSNF